MPGFRPAEMVVIIMVSPESRSPDKFIGMGSIQGQIQGKLSASPGEDEVHIQQEVSDIAQEFLSRSTVMRHI